MYCDSIFIYQGLFYMVTPYCDKGLLNMLDLGHTSVQSLPSQIQIKQTQNSFLQRSVRSYKIR